jgi:hypothetical protein
MTSSRGRGRPSRTTHAERVAIRARYAEGRNPPPPPPITLKELASITGLSAPTVWKIIHYDDVEMETRRKEEERVRRGLAELATYKRK